jgi:hypothetical protein
MDRSMRLPFAAPPKSVRARAQNIVRPRFEALLLAAVALGCAQAGWSILTPNSAGAVGAVSNQDSGADPILDLAEVQSPFAPHAVANGADSHAIAGLVSGIELKGVRMAEDHALSGAFFTFGDGAQHAFIIGQEISEGVTLADVAPHYVVLAYEGGQRRLDMVAAPSFSFARAMMGMEQAPGTPANEEAGQGHSYARDMLGLSQGTGTVEAPAEPAATIAPDPHP